MDVEAPDEVVSGPLDDGENVEGGGDEAINEDVFAVSKPPRASTR